jgi:hypothetical protein
VAGNSPGFELDDIVQYSRTPLASGQSVWYLYPERTRVNDSDLFVALASQRRMGGQIGFTGLQHLVASARLADGLGYSARNIALCAAFQLHRAYIPDVSKGLRELLPAYTYIDDLWIQHVHKSCALWPLSADEAVMRNDIDTRVTSAEMAASGIHFTEHEHDLVGGPPSQEELLLVRRIAQEKAVELWMEAAKIITRGGGKIPR